MTVNKVRESMEYGTFKRWANQPAVPTEAVLRSEAMQSDGPYPPGGQFFKAEKWWASGSVVNGGPDEYGEYTYRNDPSSARKSRRYPNILAPFDAPSVQSMATKLIADTNPNTPDVDLPAFIGELPEIPKLLQREGNALIAAARKGNFTKLLAAGNLGVQFGWAPFFRDLVSLVQFQSAFDRRVTTLNKLKKDGYRSFKRTLYKGARQNTHHDNDLDVDIWQGYLLNIWGYIVWYPDGDLPDTAEEMNRLALRAIHGLNGLSFSTSWELMPWSWLVDWCTNIGTYLKSVRNNIPMTHSTPQIMVHMRRQAHHGQKKFWGDKYTLSEGVFNHETKERFPVVGNFPVAKLPILTDSQFSILASIGVLSRWGGKR